MKRELRLSWLSKETRLTRFSPKKPNSSYLTSEILLWLLGIRLCHRKDLRSSNMTEMQTTRSYHITVITSIHHKKNSGAATKPATGKIGLLYLPHQLCFFSLLQKPNFLAPSFHWRSSSWGSEFQLGSLCLLQKGVWCCVKKGNVFFLFAVVYILPAIILPLTFLLLTARKCASIQSQTFLHSRS